MKANLLAFFRGLRQLGFRVGNDELAFTFQGLALVQELDRNTIHDVIQAIVVKGPDQRQLFNWAFDQFFLMLRGQPNPLIAPNTYLSNVLRMREHQRVPRVTWAQPDSAGDSEPPVWPDPLMVTRTGASRLEVLKTASLKDLLPEDLTDLSRLLIHAHPHQSPRTRIARAQKGRHLDLGWTLRRGQVEGEIMRLWYRKPVRSQRPAVVLLDISGSVAVFTRPFLAFFHGLLQKDFLVEVFVFGTRLTRVTDRLGLTYVESALTEVARRIPDFSGGTRLSEALEVFREQWANRVLGKGADLFIVTDGLDTGDTDRLNRQIDLLKYRAHRLEWWNPVMGRGYRPTARSARILLDRTDRLVPAASWNQLLRAWNRTARMEK